MSKDKLVHHEIHSDLHSKRSGTTKPALAGASGCLNVQPRANWYKTHQPHKPVRFSLEMVTTVIREKRTGLWGIRTADRALNL
eukprot:288820-Pelagomonas_calceolata.AAC.1